MFLVDLIKFFFGYFGGMICAFPFALIISLVCVTFRRR